MSQAEPGQLLAELREEIVGDEAHDPGQDVQDKAESRLWDQGQKMGERKKREKKN